MVKCSSTPHRLAVALLFFMLSAVPGGARAEAFKLLVFGDSLTHGYGLAAPDSFPAQLEARLTADGWPVTVVNAGNSGDTTAAGLARVDWSLAGRPDGVIVELGANDALRGIDPARTRANLEEILKRIGRQGLPLLLTGMRAPRNLGRDYAEAFDRIFPDLAEQLKVAFYPFFLEGVALRPDLNQADGIHPNREGVAEIVTRIAPYVERLLQDAGVDRQRDGHRDDGQGHGGRLVLYGGL
jgi:acyl-CoA thioesterase-1